MMDHHGQWWLGSSMMFNYSWLMTDGQTMQMMVNPACSWLMIADQWGFVIHRSWWQMASTTPENRWPYPHSNKYRLSTNEQFQTKIQPPTINCSQIKEICSTKNPKRSTHNPQFDRMPSTNNPHCPQPITTKSKKRAQQKIPEMPTATHKKPKQINHF